MTGDYCRGAFGWWVENGEIQYPVQEFTVAGNLAEIFKGIVAVGSGANPMLTSDTPDLKLNPWGYIIADEATGKTSKKAVWAGGDIVTGAATVILAMGAGRKAANSMHDYLTLGW